MKSCNHNQGERESSVFITIEGIHGAGKSTLMSALANKLSNLNLTVVEVADQRSTRIGKAIRDINLKSQLGVPSYLTEALLIAAARHESVVEVIKPSLISGNIILCERFNDAFFAFQRFGRGLSLNLLRSLASAVAEGVEVDLTLLLDIDPQIAFLRIENNLEHRIEREPLAFHQRVRQGYLAQARKHPDRIVILDASAKMNVVFQSALTRIKGLLKRRQLLYAGF